MDGYLPVCALEKSKIESDLWRVWCFFVLFG